MSQAMFTHTRGGRLGKGAIRLVLSRLGPGELAAVRQANTAPAEAAWDGSSQRLGEPAVSSKSDCERTMAHSSGKV